MRTAWLTVVPVALDGWAAESSTLQAGRCRRLPRLLSAVPPSVFRQGRRGDRDQEPLNRSFLIPSALIFDSNVEPRMPSFAAAPDGLPTSRQGGSEEIAEAILFLASDKAAFKREPRLPPTAAPQRLPDKPRDWT